MALQYFWSWVWRAAFFPLFFPACSFSTLNEPLSIVVTENSGASLDALPFFTLLEVQGVPAETEVQDLWFVQGGVSSQSAQALRSLEPTQATQKARIETIIWRESGRIWVQNTQALEPSTSYSLVGVGLGVLAEFQTLSDENSVALDQWEVLGARQIYEGGHVLLCPRQKPRERRGLKEATLHQLFDDLPVFEVQFSSVGDRAGARKNKMEDQMAFCYALPLPPSLSKDLVIVGAETGYSSLAVRRVSKKCEPQKSDLQTCHIGDDGCFEIVGDTIYWTSSSEVLSVSLEQGERTPLQFFVQAGRGKELRFGPLFPGEMLLKVSFFDAFGCRHSLEREFSVADTVPSLRIDEVYSNPYGAEPAAEWIELVNAGAEALNTQGYVLQDSRGHVVLPSLSLGPSARTIVHRSDFILQEPDPVPLAEVASLSVDVLATNGITNGGEALRLYSPQGKLLSSVPPHAVREGQSIALESLWGAEVYRVLEHLEVSPGWGKKDFCFRAGSLLARRATPFARMNYR
ncbi:MAG: lamin tail domain-containing protein [Polyangiaceae bacterium]|nr:lamin tail domain-containing protein [Polyangiaceae bacterium]